MNITASENVETAPFDRELERFDSANQINYLALYVAMISPLPISVEKSFDIVYGKAVIPSEAIVTSAYLRRIQRYFKYSRCKNIDKAEKLFRVNKFKLKAYLKGSLFPVDCEIVPIRTLSEYYKRIRF